MPSAQGFGQSAQWNPPATVSPHLGGTLGQAENRVLALDEIIGQVSMANERLHSLVADARAHADSLFGSQPEGKSEAGNSPPRPNGRVYGLRENVEATHSLIAALHDQLTRLRGI